MPPKNKSSRRMQEADFNPASFFLLPDDEEELAAHLLALLKKLNRPAGLDDILKILHLRRKEKKRIDRALHAMQEEGKIIRAGSGWAAPDKLRRLVGVLNIQRGGMGFVTPLEGKPQDIYIHPAALGDAWDGDRVEVLLLPGRRGPSSEGRVSRVLERGLSEVPVHAVRRGKNDLWTATPANPRLPALFLVDVSALPKAPEEGDLLLAIPGEKAGQGLWHAKASANLEHEETPAAQEKLTKTLHGIPNRFPAAALAEADALPKDPSEADFSNRRDLRGEAFVTIDGETAKDFDDAICVTREGDGFRLKVAIADVSHYVRPGSALDAEARLRGNSYYFPLSVEPMLPEKLSNNLCSLRPNVPRLVMTADMLFNAKGEPRKAEFYPAVIQSRARLTYTQIEHGILRGEKEEAEKLGSLLLFLKDAESLARLLLARREARGSLDFDLPEAEFSFSEAGEITGVAPRIRHFGHRLIEECMLAANEAVARFLTERRQAFLYRVHPAPDADKLKNLTAFLYASGLAERPLGKGKKAAPPTAFDLRAVLAKAAGTPIEYLVGRMVLRAMMQARYAPENEGHFGLASPCYCHFTSPIRRYADLLVHRALKEALGLPPLPGEQSPTPARLLGMADIINKTERSAVEAEREIHKRLTVLLLRDKVGEEFPGVVSGLADFGFFVELPELTAEGMVRLSSLGDDFYEHIPERGELRGVHTRRTFRLGDPVKVIITDVNLGRQEVNLALADQADGGFGKKNSALKRPEKKQARYGRSGEKRNTAPHGKSRRKRP